MRAEIKHHTCKCGRTFRTACTEQWQRDFVNNNRLGKLCDTCSTPWQPTDSKAEYDAAKNQFLITAEELHREQEAGLRCQNMKQH
jgi:hypothetical protein